MVCYRINIDNTEVYIPKYQTPLDLNLIPELYNRLTTLDIGVLILTRIYKQVTKKYRTIYIGFTDGYDKFDYLVLIPEYLLNKYKRITVVLEDIKRIKFYNMLEGKIISANTVIDDSNTPKIANINRYFYINKLIKSLIVSEFMKLNGMENYRLKYKKVSDIITFKKISELKSIRLDPV